MTRSWCLLAVLLLAVVVLHSQQLPVTQTIPSFKSSTKLVVVPVVVSDKAGAMRGLTKSDFVLQHDGKAEPVAVFEEVEVAAPKIERVKLPPGTVQNYAEASNRQDVVILLLDFLNGGWSSTARIRAYLKDMSAELASRRTPVTLLLLSRQGLVQAHSFTTSPEELVKAVDDWTKHEPAPGMTPGPTGWASPYSETDPTEGSSVLKQFALPLGLTDRRNLDQAHMTMQAFEQLAEAFRGVPGRKKLVWISTGFPTGLMNVRQTPASTPGSTMLNEFQIGDKARRAWQALSDSNIVIYPVDSNQGAENTDWEAHFAASQGRSAAIRPSSLEVETNSSSMMEMAQRTGGRNCTTNMNECLGKVLEDGSHYYVLGFYLHGDAKPGWHKLKVSLNGRDASIRARQGFMVGTAEAPTKVEQRDEVLTALASPLDYTSVPLRLSWTRQPGRDGNAGIELVVTSPPGGIGVRVEDSALSVDILAFARELGKGEGTSIPASIATKLSAAQASAFARSGFAFRKQIQLAPGKYELRVFVRDNSNNKMGTVSTLVDISKK